MAEDTQHEVFEQVSESVEGGGALTSAAHGLGIIPQNTRSRSQFRFPPSLFPPPA